VSDEALAAGAVHGVRVVPSTEISAVDGQYEDLHVLGYGIDHRSALLGERLLDARADRERRADAMADRLRELGFEVDPAPIEARKAAGKPVGGRTWRRRCWRTPRTPNARSRATRTCPRSSRVSHSGHARLRGPLASHRRGGDRVDPRGRGVAVWAHPFWDVKDSDEVLAAISRYRAVRPRRRRGVLSAHTRSRRSCWLVALRSWAAEHRLVGLPRARPPALLLVPLVRLFGCEPNLGPIAHGTLAAPSRGQAGCASG
jgi:hypothetical protein